ncbi:hypothetical protein U3516DRAFT_573484, partial [Neocallimastix sp. 'constans']
YKCCSNLNIKGVENGKLKVIGYKRCTFSLLDYDYCSSINPEVRFTEENGK